MSIWARMCAPGSCLPQIEAPKSDQQLQQAREALTTAQANQKLAEITADRYNNLFKTDSVVEAGCG